MIDEEAEVQKIREAYQVTFGTTHGKMVLEDLEKSCYYHRTTFTGDVHETMVNEGMRTVVTLIHRMLQPGDEYVERTGTHEYLDTNRTGPDGPYSYNI